MARKSQTVKDTTADTIYMNKRAPVAPFEFNSDVAFVFDDMISRSVPLYGEVQKLCGLLCRTICKESSSVIDLGCSTGTTIVEIHRQLAGRTIRFTGVDNSEAMLSVCEQKLRAHQVQPAPVLVCADLAQYVVAGADVALMNYTLQFVAPKQRKSILTRIHDGLTPGGYLILSEKVIHSDAENHSILTDLHLDFKREHGYSELEISQKRDALEDVLTPLTLDQNIELLEGAGFTAVDVVFKAFSFATLLARKASR